MATARAVTTKTRQASRLHILDALAERPATPTALRRRPVHPGRTQVDAWRRDALAIEQAAAGHEPEEDPRGTPTNLRCWGWLALGLLLIGGGLLVWRLSQQCWSWWATIGC